MILRRGNLELQLIINSKTEYIDVFLKSPRSTRMTSFENGQFHRNQQWVGGEVKYDFNFNFILKVPKNMDLEVSTVNNGNVTVSNMASEDIVANNVNGNVALKNIAESRTNARTVNGKITVNYLGNPHKDSEFSTINGDITVSYQKSLSAKLYFKSMQGEFYSDFDVKPIANFQPIKSESSASKTRFKLDNSTAVQVGDGEIEHKFNTLNGDVYVKKS